mmetsp:Transcript_19165/g.53450  ORF Transcript_19165/g.53450 Transcript_19165/m.53450 type:complete len:216 (-) Transcript_19165:219-866(-)
MQALQGREEGGGPDKARGHCHAAQVAAALDGPSLGVDTPLQLLGPHNLCKLRLPILSAEEGITVLVYVLQTAANSGTGVRPAGNGDYPGMPTTGCSGLQQGQETEGKAGRAHKVCLEECADPCVFAGERRLGRQPSNTGVVDQEVQLRELLCQGRCEAVDGADGGDIKLPDLQVRTDHSCFDISHGLLSPPGGPARHDDLHAVAGKLLAGGLSET